MKPVQPAGGAGVTESREAPRPVTRADPAERWTFAGSARQRSAFAFCFAAALGVHLLVLAMLLLGEFSAPAEPARVEEIPVEILAGLPPETKPELPAKPLPPPPPDLVTPPPVKEKPPPEKVQLDDVKQAFDAPASGNAARTQKAEADKETKAPQQAPPPKIAAKQPNENKPEQEKASAPQQDKAEQSQPPEPQKAAEDEPDAEGLDKAQPKPPAKAKAKTAPKPDKTQPAQGNKATVAQQLAALAPAPSYSIGASAKAAPIGGGTEKASYESLLMGLIIRKLHLPAEARARRLLHIGRIGLFVDEMGNLTHQALYRASGDPALDAAWLAAVRSAAPFPAPPRNLPHGFLLQFSNQD
ncbi:MAG TPA: TonB C-terminal domain-containing protein [Methylocella sp.]|nr:TonB C-terminal domain-containing protein [Methylocella sp.]